MLRIVLDARPLSHPQAGGFRTYTRALVRGLAEINSPETSLLLYVDRPLPPDAPALSGNMEVRVLDPSRLRTDLRAFRRQLRRDRPDLVHGTMNYLPFGVGAPSTVTIHDAMGIKTYPFVRVRRNLRERLIHGYWKRLTRRSARRARRIVTVSEGSAAEIRGALGIAPERFSVVHNGLTLPAPRANVARAENTVLALASPDPRKNVAALFRALSEERERFARPPCLQLVCTDSLSAQRAEASLRGHGVSGYRLLRGLDDPALSDAYAGATAFVWPSRMEGFGLPPLEAMATGCPVVSSSAPSMPEVLGTEAPAYFDPDRPDELADRLAALLADPEDRARRGRAGRERAAAFTCRRMAEQTLSVWRDALEEGA